MRTSDGRFSARVATHDRREDFVAVVESLLPQIASRLEVAALYAMVAVFWGLVTYMALTVALR